VITVTVYLFSDFSEQSDQNSDQVSQNSDQVSQNRTETNNLLRAIAEGQKRGTFGSQCTFTIRPNAARSNRGSIHSGLNSGSHTGSDPESKTTKSLELAEKNCDDNRITLTCDETQVSMKPNLTLPNKTQPNLM
jgi:hypothetical protein